MYGMGVCDVFVCLWGRVCEGAFGRVGCCGDGWGWVGVYW